MPSDEDSGSGHHGPNEDAGMPNPDGSGPAGPNANIGFGAALNEGASAAEASQVHGSEAGIIIVSGSFWDQAAHATDQGTSAAHQLQIGEYTPVYGSSALGTSSLAVMHIDVMSTDTAVHTGSLESAAVTPVAHADFGTMSHFEVAAPHVEFASQMHI